MYGCWTDIQRTLAMFLVFILDIPMLPKLVFSILSFSFILFTHFQWLLLVVFIPLFWSLTLTRFALFLYIRCFDDRSIRWSVDWDGKTSFICVCLQQYRITVSKYTIYAHLFAQAMNFDLFSVSYSIYSFLMQ